MLSSTMTRPTTTSLDRFFLDSNKMDLTPWEETNNEKSHL